MKRILTIILAFSFFGFLSCTKERLVIKETELEFDENSEEYQTYQAERAMQYIRTFRFEKLGDVLDKINDPTVKKSLQDSLSRYRYLAANEALYYLTKNNDTLFFMPPINGTQIGTNFLGNDNRLVNDKGVIHGFKNFPETETLHFYNNLASGVEGLEFLPNLKILRWVINPDDVIRKYPGEDFEYVPVRADLSRNAELKEIAVSGIELGNFIYPDHELELFSNGGIFATAGGNRIPTGSLDGLWAKTISVGGDADPDFKMKNVRTDSLYFSSAIKNFDISETEIKGLKIGQIEKLVLNDKLERLWLSSGNLLSKPNFPQSLEELDLSGYELSDKDFSSTSNLKKISLSTKSFEGLLLPGSIEDITFYLDRYNGSSAGINRDYSNLPRLKSVTINNGDFDQTGLIFPESLEYLSFFDWSPINVRGAGDYSNLHNLKTFAANQVSFERMPVLPASLSTLQLNGISLPEASTMDLGNLTNLDFLRVHAYYSEPVTLILPDNLTEAAVSAGYGGVNGVWASIILPVGSTIVNAPEWLSQYVYIGTL